MKKYAFLDRDGTLIFEPTETYQVDTIAQLKILEGVMEGLKLLIKQGYTLMMITNQDGLGSASYSLSSFEEIQDALLRTFKQNGIIFQKIFICPHLPSKNCDCRKPKLGLVEKIADIDKETSFVCGDRNSDRQFAKNLGIRFIPIQTNGNIFNALKKYI